MSNEFMLSPILGIVGGLGPAASALFYSMIVKYTSAFCDNEHIDTIIYSVSSTPDRTDFIMGRNNKNPLNNILCAVRSLENQGADIIAIPCNTAEYFHKEIENAVNIPVLNIVEETALFVAEKGIKKVGVLSTKGTSISGIYKNTLEKHGILYEPVTAEEQERTDKLIYGKIKKGLPVKKGELSEISQNLFCRGCEYVILGCTELSLAPEAIDKKSGFVDSLTVLAAKCISACGRKICGLPEFYIKS